MSDQENAAAKPNFIKSCKPHQDNEEKLSRTIFVGNWPIHVNKQKLSRFFSKYGPIESSRFRSWPLDDMKKLKKVAVIKNEHHEKRSSTNAYIVFKDKTSAIKAQQANATVFEGHHLRVNFSTEKSFEHNKAIFVGNIPFDSEDEDIWKIFSDCGEIVGVHIVRDKQTGIGRGFAYVNFKESSSVELALKLDQSKQNGRALRISRSSARPSDTGGHKWKSRNRNQKFAGDRIAKKFPQLSTAQNSNDNTAKEINMRRSFQGQRSHIKKKFNKKTIVDKKIAKKLKPRWPRKPKTPKNVETVTST